MNLTIHSEDVWEEFPMSLKSLRANLFEPRWVPLYIAIHDPRPDTLSQRSETLEDVQTTQQGCIQPLRAIRQLGAREWKGCFGWRSGASHHSESNATGCFRTRTDGLHQPSGSHNTCTCIEDAMTLSTLFSLPATKPQTSMLLNVFEELRQPRCASVQRYVRRKREVITIPHGPGQRRRDQLLRTQRAYHQEDELDDEFLCSTYSGFLQIYGFNAREAVQDWWVKLGKSVLSRSPGPEKSDDDDDDDDGASISLPVVVDAEVEREGPAYPIITDPLMGDDEDVVRETAAQRRSQQ